MNNELKKTCTRSLFMQFKRKFSMHPNNQTTCTLRDLASLKQTACLCLIPSRSSALYVRTQTSTGTCVSDCIGGCQNMRMHLQKAGACTVTCTVCVCVFVHLNCRIMCGCMRGCMHSYVCVWNWDDQNVRCEQSKLMCWIHHRLNHLVNFAAHVTRVYCLFWVSLSLPQSFFAETTLRIQRIFSLAACFD